MQIPPNESNNRILLNIATILRKERTSSTFVMGYSTCSTDIIAGLVSYLIRLPVETNSSVREFSLSKRITSLPIV